ncbi:MAG: hypothetical protein CME70_15300 [Halobacteriovorax sp.]|nr:hypothetical protein [Halobacteriovorax sp.]|tara:strand:+ start:69772 stop:70104 length:333 start_codon:yes stop_codon:yes gene_type:complete
MWEEKVVTKTFGNAPLPKRFENEAIFSPDGSEFALPADTAKLFINWCLESGLEVMGFDVWLAGPTDNTSLDEFNSKGDAGHCLKEIERTLTDSKILKYNRSVLFNIWVNF